MDITIASNSGAPLDLDFYQTVKGMVEALPALHPGSTLLQVSGCAEGVGSPAYRALMARWGNRWQDFLAHLQATAPRTELDQWEMQMQCRVLAKIERLPNVTEARRHTV